MNEVASMLSRNTATAEALQRRSAGAGPGDDPPFDQVLERAARHAQQAGAQAQTPLREAASNFVSSAFIYPVLEQLHSSPLGAGGGGPLAPGTGERRFTPLLDMHLAERITSAANFPLVDRIVERLSNAAAAAPPRTGGTDNHA